MSRPISKKYFYWSNLGGDAVQIMNYDFGAYVADGREQYFWEINGSRINKDDGKPMSKALRFPDSLLGFLYMDADEVEPFFQQLYTDLWQFTLTQEQEYVDDAFVVLDELAEKHIYFWELCLDYKWRIAHAKKSGDYSDNILRLQVASAMPGAMRRIQLQLLDLFENVLDIDGEKKPVRKKLAAFYHDRGDEAFKFAQQPMSFELIDEETFAEVLHPNSIYDLIDYHVRECIRQEVRLRRCKNCGRWFAIMGRSTAEYCDRPVDERGRTCKDVGAIALWTKNKKTDTLFNDYRREYKKRFARTKVGKYDTATLYAWGEQARAKVEECRAEKITADEFHEWLENS